MTVLSLSSVFVGNYVCFFGASAWSALFVSATDIDVGLNKYYKVNI